MAKFLQIWSHWAFHKYNSIRLGRYKPSSPVSCCARKKHGKEDNIFSQTCHFSDLCILCLRVGQWCHETVGEQICTGRPGACSIKLILHNLRPFCRKLRNFYNLWANLRSKFGRNNKSVIYGSVKFYGIGPRTPARGVVFTLLFVISELGPGHNVPIDFVVKFLCGPPLECGLIFDVREGFNKLIFKCLWQLGTNTAKAYFATIQLA